MLKLITNNSTEIINTDDFYITHKTSGLDELTFNISVRDINYPRIVEEAIIEYEQPYLVKAIDAGMKTAKVKCQLNVDELKTKMYPKYSNDSATLADTVNDVIPSGWLFLDNAHSTIKRTIEGGFTPYDIIFECANTYDVAFQFDVKRRRITAYNLDNFEPLGAFASSDLNLKEINYKGKSTSFYTRLYAYGKNGLSFSDINGGKPYVDNHQYSDKVICAYWQDDRYEVKTNLLEDAKKKVNLASIPERSYECAVIDLAKTNPEMYKFQDFSLFSVIRLIDDAKELAIDYQVVEYQEYPFYSEKNVVTLSSTPPKIQNAVKELKNEITNPNSGFWSVMHTAIDSATDWITGVNGGYVIFHKDENDIPYEILIMDTPDIATAKNVWRWNQNGFGHSSHGYNGPYDLAMTIDGAIVANFITAGTMLADRIKGGTLDLGGATGGNGSMRVYSDAKEEIGRWDKNGISIKKGTIAGPSITLGGSNNKNGVIKVQNSSGSEIGRWDNKGIYTTGAVTSDNTKDKTAVQLYNGQLYIFGEDGTISGIISWFNDGLTLQSYGGDGVAHIIIKRNGEVRITAAKQFNFSSPKVSIDDFEAKTGRAVFSDGTYLDFRKGMIVGGNTKEGAF